MNSNVERFHRTLREDALNHFIFLSASHVRRVAREFIEYYNRARPSQGRKRSFRGAPGMGARHGVKVPSDPLLEGIRREQQLRQRLDPVHRFGV